MLRYKISPKDHQKQAVNHIFRRKFCGIRHGTGMGKTYTSLVAAVCMLEMNKVDKVFISIPKAAVDAYEKDIEELTYFDENDVNWIWKREDYSNDYPINIIPHTRLKHVYDLIPNGSRMALFVDEVHALKSGKSKIRKLFNSIRGRFLYVVGMTATPLANKIDDLYYTTSYMEPKYFGSWWNYRSKFCHMIKRTSTRMNKKGEEITYEFHDIIGYKNLEVLREQVNTFWHSAFEDMPKNWIEYTTYLTNEEEDEYLDAAKGFIQGTYKDFVSRLPEMQKIIDLSETKQRFVYKIVRALLDEDKGVIVYFPFKEALQKFNTKFNNMGMVLNGNTSLKKRRKIREGFGDGKLILMTSAGGKSYNFHAGNQIVFYTIPFAVLDFIQVIGRQARPLVSEFDFIDVHMPIVLDTIDEYRKRLLQMNKGLIERLLYGGDPNLPKDMESLKKHEITALRKRLLWKMRS
jgi:superfamily II DNA or RNA helicase